MAVFAVQNKGIYRRDTVCSGSCRASGGHSGSSPYKTGNPLALDDRGAVTRRSAPQKRIDDNAFPVRVKIYVPENGFGRLMDDIFVWLKGQLEAYRYAHHSSGAGGGRDQTAFYFATTSDADAFMQAFPELELADGTLEITHTAPGLVHPLGQTRMCNLYNQTTSQEAMRRLFDDLEDKTSNLQSGQVYPNQMAPIVRHDEGQHILQMARWGLPTPKSYLVGKTTIRVSPM